LIFPPHADLQYCVPCDEKKIVRPVAMDRTRR
jgi:hypothetical protein